MTGRAGLDALIREMTAPDPDDRPSASQVVKRLAALTAPGDATGEWQPSRLRGDVGRIRGEPGRRWP